MAAIGIEKQNSLTQEQLKELLEYDTETGQFTWKKHRYENRIGKNAGTQTDVGYYSIYLNGKHYKAHRLAFLYMTGSWPEHFIDHIDGDGGNNSWANLREATAQQNSMNQRIHRE